VAMGHRVLVQVREVFAIDVQYPCLSAGQVYQEDLSLGLGCAATASATAWDDSNAGIRPRCARAGGRRERLGVGGGGVLGPALVMQPGVLRADQRIVEARETECVSETCPSSSAASSCRRLQNAGSAAGEARGVLAQRGARAAGFDSDQANLRVFDEAMENTMAFEPPPTQAKMACGKRRSTARIGPGLLLR